MRAFVNALTNGLYQKLLQSRVAMEAQKIWNETTFFGSQFEVCCKTLGFKCTLQGIDVFNASSCIF